MLGRLKVVRFIITSLAYVLFAALSFSTICHHAIVIEHAGIIAQYENTTQNPYARRALMPIVLRAVHRALPGGLKKEMHAFAERSNLRTRRMTAGEHETVERLSKLEGHETVVLLGLFLKYACLVGFLFTLRYALRVFFDPHPFITDFLPLLSLLFLQLFNANSNLIYDYTLLVLFTLCLTFMKSENWKGHYIAFPLAVLNKETAAILAVVFALATFRSMKRKEYISHLAAQLAIYAAVMCILV